MIIDVSGVLSINTDNIIGFQIDKIETVDRSVVFVLRACFGFDERTAINLCFFDSFNKAKECLREINIKLTKGAYYHKINSTAHLKEFEGYE